MKINCSCVCFCIFSIFCNLVHVKQTRCENHKCTNSIHLWNKHVIYRNAYNAYQSNPNNDMNFYTCLKTNLSNQTTLLLRPLWLKINGGLNIEVLLLFEIHKFKCPRTCPWSSNQDILFPQKLDDFTVRRSVLPVRLVQHEDLHAVQVKAGWVV